MLLSAGRESVNRTRVRCSRRGADRDGLAAEMTPWATSKASFRSAFFGWEIEGGECLRIPGETVAWQNDPQWGQ